ncbi:MAG: nitroreductase family protein [Saprospiraceae bacterium]
MDPFIPFKPQPSLSKSEMIQLSESFFAWLNARRSVRDFSSKPIPKVVISNIIQSASTAPSGAHKQPWTFCAISNTQLKKEIRMAAEKEEFENYHGRMSDEWIDDLKAFGTNEMKEFLTIAPWLIIVFKKSYDLENGVKRKNYYVTESVGIACGMLLTAIHNAGLVALTHTPSPMNFLKKILNRPENETPFLLVPVGFPANDARVPDLTRKLIDEVSVWYE